MIKSRKTLIVCVTMLLPWFYATAQAVDSSAALKSVAEPPAWTERKTVAVILSTLIPGSGQTYLGQTEKGAAFTLGAFGSVLMTVTSESDVVGRNERLDELKAAYAVATSFQAADNLWSQMLETKDLLDSEVRRRNLFRTIAVAVWVANIVDVIFFTDDLGEKTFGSVETPSTRISLVPSLRNGVNAVVSIRF